MRWSFAGIVAFVAILAGCYSEPYMQHSRGYARRADTVGVMTNHDIVALSRAGIADSVIISLMEISETGFRLHPDDVIALSDSGVSSKVVHAMISRAGEPRGDHGLQGYSYYPSYGWSWYYPAYMGWYPWYPSLYFGLYGYYGPWYAHAFYAHRPYFVNRGWYRFPSMRSYGGIRGGGMRRR
jgi:hypothetical protein